MRDGRIAEWMLSRTMRADRAAAVAGDLVEEAGERGRLWFWTALVRTTVAFCWLGIVTGIRRLLRPAATPLESLAETTAMTTSPLRSGFAVLWNHKRLILVPALLFTGLAAATSVMFPARYESTAMILLVPAQVAASPVVTQQSAEQRIEILRQQITSRTKLERIIKEFDLYPLEGTKMEDVVERMRKNISISIVSGSNGSDMTGLRVRFVAPRPRTAMLVAEKLASLIVQSNTQAREMMAGSAFQFIDSQLQDVRARIDKLDRDIAEKGGSKVSRADTLEMDALEKRYVALLAKREDARFSEQLERRQIGEQYRVIDTARLPEHPIGPDRQQITLMGTMTGLTLGLFLVARRIRLTQRAAHA